MSRVQTFASDSSGSPPSSNRCVILFVHLRFLGGVWGQRGAKSAKRHDVDIGVLPPWAKFSVIISTWDFITDYFNLGFYYLLIYLGRSMWEKHTAKTTTHVTTGAGRRGRN